MECLNDTSQKKKFQYPTLLSAAMMKSKEKSNPEYNPRQVQNLIITAPQNKSLALGGVPKLNNSIVRKLNDPNDHPSGSPLVRSFPLRTPNEFSEHSYNQKTPDEIINTHPDLPDWTKAEIMNYQYIYYLSKIEKTQDMDYDDEEGDYKVIYGDDIQYRYEIQENLGKGTFGKVVKAYDHAEKKIVAIKIIKNKQRYSEQASIEIEILKYLKTIDHVPETKHLVKLEDNFLFRNHIVFIT